MGGIIQNQSFSISKPWGTPIWETPILLKTTWMLDSKMLSFRSLAFVWKHPEGVSTCSSHPAIDRVEVNRKVVRFSHQKRSKNGDSQPYGFPLSLDRSSRSHRYHLIVFLPCCILPLGHFSLLTRRQHREMPKTIYPMAMEKVPDPLRVMWVKQ